MAGVVARWMSILSPIVTAGVTVWRYCDVVMNSGGVVLLQVDSLTGDFNGRRHVTWPAWLAISLRGGERSFFRDLNFKILLIIPTDKKRNMKSFNWCSNIYLFSLTPPPPLLLLGRN